VIGDVRDEIPVAGGRAGDGRVGAAGVPGRHAAAASRQEQGEGHLRAVRVEDFAGVAAAGGLP
jgi:hypothetical protein